MNWRFWAKKEPIVKFKSVHGDFTIASPVASAGKVHPQWFRDQTDKKFTACPGLTDFFRTGYVITSHADIHIKANSVGTIATVTSPVPLSPILQPVHFDQAVVAGVAPIQPCVKPASVKVPLPWAVFCKPGYSILVLPALLHSDFADKLFVYPGVIDSENYHTINFVFSALRECEIVLPTGTPLLQIIPFRREDVHAECGKATEHELDRMLYTFASRTKHYYRKYLGFRKTYTMSCPYNHRERTNEKP